ncbi:unnamed protein product [Strongylus vulgaris]|uniref:Uncharacterized protein n=1 Tax=Strongylus vulgaris TaxID=40348 RepID=A0A3P7LCY4_STRVU|nr:unnamed protein product [Strongylus vulgaris]
MSEEEFNELFKEATHVHLCIRLDGTNYKTLRMPKLKRMFPFSDSLTIVNNPNLEAVVLGQDRNTFVMNMRVENNTKLSDPYIFHIEKICNKKNIGSKCEIKGMGIPGNPADFTTQSQALSQASNVETTQTLEIEEDLTTVLSEGDLLGPLQ